MSFHLMLFFSQLNGGTQINGTSGARYYLFGSFLTRIRKNFTFRCDLGRKSLSLYTQRVVETFFEKYSLEDVTKYLLGL
jgi:hypothetical protein